MNHTSSIAHYYTKELARMGIQAGRTFWDIMQTKLRLASWKLTRPWIPRRCLKTHKLLWFTECYKGTRIIGGESSAIKVCHFIIANKETFWLDRDEFILWTITRTE